MSALTDKAADLGYGAAWSGLRHVPQGVAMAAANRMAARAVRRRGPGVIQLARNLRRVLAYHSDRVDPADLSAVVHAGMRSYARFWVETFRLPAMDLDEVAERALASTSGIEHVRAATEAGRGVVLALPHSGNWDVAGLMITHVFGGLTSVNERLKPEQLYDRFVEYRRSLGMEILPLTGEGSAHTSATLKQRLREGKVVCLLADRDLTASGIRVDLFGEAIRMPAGPAMLAALTDADLMPVHLTNTDTGWHIEIHPPLELPGTRLAERVRLGSQALADVFTADIATAPADWHMLQPLWLADLPAERR